jgi:hypothetical protein
MTKDEQRNKIYELLINGDVNGLWEYPDVLDADMANLFINIADSYEMILVYNLEKFRHLNFEIAEKLIKLRNWEINEVVENSFDLFKLTESERKELRQLINQDEDFLVLKCINELGMSKQDIFDRCIAKGDVNKITNNLGFFDKTLESRENAKKLIDNLGDYKLIRKINAKFDQSLDRLIDLSDEIFGEYATEDCYKTLVRIYNHDKFTVSELDMVSGGEPGLEEIKLRLKRFTQDIQRGNKTRIILDDEEKRQLYSVFFKNLKRRDTHLIGTELVGLLWYIDLS